MIQHNLFIVIILIIILIAVPFLFLNSLQNTIKKTDASIRVIEPYEVWLCLIPIVGVFFHLSHIIRISKTIQKDFEKKGIDDYNEYPYGKNYGLMYWFLGRINLGLIIFFYFKLFSNFKLLFIQNYSDSLLENFKNEIKPSLILIPLVSLLTIFFFIIYWVKIDKYKSILINFKSDYNESTQKEYNKSLYQIKNNKTCSNCGAPTSNEHKFCMECGGSNFINEKSNEKTCTNCGNSISLESNDCGFCKETKSNITNDNVINKDNDPNKKLFILLAGCLLLIGVVYFFMTSHIFEKSEDAAVATAQDSTKVETSDTVNNIVEPIEVQTPNSVDTIDNSNIYINNDSEQYNQNSVENIDDNIYNTASLDEKPDFPGGIEKFYKFIGQNFQVPEEEGLKGKIFVTFVVEKDGSLSDIKVIRDIGYNTGKEAIRVLKYSPRWIPGKKDGKTVRVSYELPINIQSAE
ncbi:energy transducer TonB [Flavobacterium aciduliphilum]|uniref:Double zinc ribbon protein n=1 Tax=Flavobacterium aciduliphilum TaxID=1101402 RepID=A0A328YEW8_9FLAO|nr:energy transducer TonB [Flavobacterium aciduliphilum]RAR72551.1 double zinc ribbon protein [Flavobacterium aciduliphilum]